jgi:hypothetical protein
VVSIRRTDRFRRRGPLVAAGVALAAAVAVAAAVLVTHSSTAPTPQAKPPTAGVLGKAVIRSRTPRCTRYASTTGSDSAPGTRRRPFASVGRLVASLRPGQTGCLLRGRYVQDVTVRHGGTAGKPITIRSAPGQVATLQGRLWIAEGANDVTFTRMRLDGRNSSLLPSPSVDGDHDSFTYVDVTNDKMGGHDDGDGICFALGDDTGRYGTAHNTLIARSTIHDCGTADNHNHGIYVASSVGARIVGNWIWDNGDRGVQLYPNAQNTLVEFNIIAGNGEGVIFSGDQTHASSGNVVTRNTIVDSRIRHNVEYWWPGPVGTDNVVSHNCLWGGAQGNIATPAVGYTLVANTIAQPRFAASAQPAPILPKTPCAADSPAALGGR